MTIEKRLRYILGAEVWYSLDDVAHRALVKLYKWKGHDKAEQEQRNERVAEILRNATMEVFGHDWDTLMTSRSRPVFYARSIMWEAMRRATSCSDDTIRKYMANKTSRSSIARVKLLVPTLMQYDDYRTMALDYERYLKMNKDIYEYLFDYIS